MNALTKQVAGSHYKSLPIQPVEFCQRNGLGFCESSVIKYVSRHREKNGRQDIEKAIHFLELLLDMEYPEQNLALKHGMYISSEIRACETCMQDEACDGAMSAVCATDSLSQQQQGNAPRSPSRIEIIGHNGNNGEHYFALKDHEFAQMVNELTAMAEKYRDTQQLRSRIRSVVAKYFPRGESIPKEPAESKSNEEATTQTELKGFCPLIKHHAGDCPIPWANEGEYLVFFPGDEIFSGSMGFSVDEYDWDQITHYTIKEDWTVERMRDFVGRNVMFRDSGSDEWQGPWELSIVNPFGEPFSVYNQQWRYCRPALPHEIGAPGDE